MNDRYFVYILMGIITCLALVITFQTLLLRQANRKLREYREKPRKQPTSFSAKNQTVYSKNHVVDSDSRNGKRA